MTVGDKVQNFYDKWIKVSLSKETRLTSKNMYSEEMTKGTDDPALTPERRRELAYQSPIFMKGIRKKSLDSIRAWLDLETDNGTNIISADERAIRAFEKRSNYKAKFNQAVVDANIYGDGFLLIHFDALDKDKKLEEVPALNSEPRSVDIICPEYILKTEYLNEENEKLSLAHYVFNDGKGEKLIHPSRIQHIIIDRDSKNSFGISKVDLLRNTIKSKKHVDIAVGRILSWFSSGLLDIKVKDLGDDDAKRVKATAKKHPSVWMHDEDDFEIEYIKPTAIDPKPFMDFLVLNIASGLVMPVHVLTGIQVGKVTGAEIGFADYYRDIRDIQDLIYTPLIEDLYRKIIQARGRTWKYNLIWKTVYVDELGEANIMDKRTEFVTKGVAGGVISVEEGREMLNVGMIELEPGKIPKPPMKPPTPDIKPKDKKEKEEDD